MQATQKQTRLNVPGGGWITIEQEDGYALVTVAEGNAAAILAAQIAKNGMAFDQAVAHCEMCLKGEREVLQETVYQQQDFVLWCQAQIALIGNNNLKARNEYEMLISSAQYEIRLTERRLKESSKELGHIQGRRFWPLYFSTFKSKAMQNFTKDDTVTYIPEHAKSDINHPDCQIGRVTDVWEGKTALDPPSVWVSFSGAAAIMLPARQLVLHPKKLA